ncbi:dihydroorotase [Hydrogenophilus islandicus]
MSERIILPRPDDWHLHVRDGAALAAVVPHTAAVFGRALIMPNLKPPVVTVADALAYRERILQVVRPLPGAAAHFTPVMTLYLTEATPVAEIDRAAETGGLVRAVKLYPAGATTNAESGVRRIEAVYPILARMEERGIVLCVHGEVTDPDVDVFDREARFIERVLAPIVDRFPRLNVVLEHITTADAVDFVASASERVAATITAHHLLYNRNALFQGGIRPHYYCLPVLKRERHRQALLAAATSGNPKFFLGSDSAPHAKSTKEAACGCAGCYTAYALLPLYAKAFAEAGALERLPDFASRFGAEFYGLPVAKESVTLVRRPWQIPEALPYLPGDPLVPLAAGEMIDWQVEVSDEANRSALG